MTFSFFYITFHLFSILLIIAPWAKDLSHQILTKTAPNAKRSTRQNMKSQNAYQNQAKARSPTSSKMWKRSKNQIQSHFKKFKHIYKQNLSPWKNSNSNWTMKKTNWSKSSSRPKNNQSNGFENQSILSKKVLNKSMKMCARGRDRLTLIKGSMTRTVEFLLKEALAKTMK